MSTSAVRSGARRPAPSAVGDGVRTAFPQRIRFGSGRSHLAAELRHLRAERALFLRTERHEATVRRLAPHDVEIVVLGGTACSPDAVRPHRPGVVVAVGGGTILSQAKRVCAILDIPLIALPTTYSAEELDHRVAGPGPVLDTAVAPTAVIYDPCLALTLSPRQTGSSLLGAISVGLEVLASTEPGSSPWTFAAHGLRELGRAALDAVYCPGSLAPRSVVQFGAYLVGAAATTAQTSAAVGAARELVAEAGIDDAEARATVTLRLVDFIADARPDVHAALLSAWPWTDPSTFLNDLAAGSGATPAHSERLTRHIAAIAQKYGI